MTDQTYDPQAQPKGSNWWKWCLGCGCAALLIGGIATAVAISMGAALVSQMVPVTDPVQVQQRLSAIVPSQPPPGYEGVMAMSIPGVFQMAMIAPQGFKQQQQGNQPPQLLLMVCTLPPGAHMEEMKRKMKDALQQAPGGQTGELMVEAEDGEQTVQTVTVRGQSMKLEQTVGRSQDGRRVKQVVMLLPRDADSEEMVLIMGMGDADNFDQAALDAYLQSIR